LDVDTLHQLMVQRTAAPAGAAGRDLVAQGLRAAQSMVRLAPLPGGGHGYEIYHHTFRQYIREDRSGDIGPQNDFAKESFCQLAREWSTLPAGHPARRYVVRHGLAHCRVAGHPGEAADLAARVAASGEWDLLTDLVEAMHRERVVDPALVE